MYACMYVSYVRRVACTSFTHVAQARRSLAWKFMGYMRVRLYISITRDVGVRVGARAVACLLAGGEFAQ